MQLCGGSQQVQVLMMREDQTHVIFGETTLLQSVKIPLQVEARGDGVLGRR